MFKVITLIFLTFASFNASAWFNVNANCFLSSGATASCEACNFVSHRPIFCRMKVQGQTSYGAWFKGNQAGWVSSGQCIFGNVYANNPYIDPLIFADARVQCRF